MPRRKVLARALCAFTFGGRFRWQVFSHQTHHPERWDFLMFRVIKTPQNHNTKRNLPKIQMEGIEQCKIPLFKKDCFSLWSLKPWGNDPLWRLHILKMGWFNHLAMLLAKRMHLLSQILLMVQKSGLHQLRLAVYPIFYRVSDIPGGCLGFLNHQQ